MKIEPRIREALRRQKIAAADLTETQRERAARITEDQPDLRGAAAVARLMTEPEPPAPEPEPEPESEPPAAIRTVRDPDAADLAARAHAFAGTKSRFQTNEARRFLDELTVGMEDELGYVEVTRDGATETLALEMVDGFADGSLSRAERPPLATSLATLGKGVAHWDRALAAMISVQAGRR